MATEGKYQPSIIRSFFLSLFKNIMILLGKFLVLFGYEPYSSFDVESMKKEAMAMGDGLSDFGDEPLQPVLNKIFHYLRTDKDMTLFGRWFLHHHWVENIFRYRLLLTRDYKLYPNINNVPIRRPLFVLGNPRTGSTFFHFLLFCDPNTYAPPLWQTGYPSPPPLHDGKYDPRIDLIRSEMNLYFDIEPLIRAMHPVDIDLPHECYHLFDRTYLDSQWPARCQNKGGFEYYESLKDEDVIAHYSDYKRQLQLLALNHPGFSGESPIHFSMKDPNPLHNYFPQAMINTFPDANLIEVHRNPADSLQSYLLLEGTVSELIYGKNFDHKSFGHRMLQTFITRRLRLDAFRATFPKERYLDINYNDLLRDPVLTLKKAYAHFNYPYTQEFEDRMKVFIENNQQHKHGRYHEKFSFEKYGLTREGIESHFADYIATHRLNKRETKSESTVKGV